MADYDSIELTPEELAAAIHEAKVKKYFASRPVFDRVDCDCGQIGDKLSDEERKEKGFLK